MFTSAAAVQTVAKEERSTVSLRPPLARLPKDLIKSACGRWTQSWVQIMTDVCMEGGDVSAMDCVIEKETCELRTGREPQEREVIWTDPAKTRP